MTGNPKVLAGLQQAYLASDAAMFASRRAMIRYAWRAETGTSIHDAHSTDAAIRSWTPPPAEPSLEQRMAELERAQLHTDQSVGTLLDSTAMLRLTDDTLSNDVQSLHERLRVLEEPERHPEPTAPDLDPVRVEAAARAAWMAADKSFYWSDLTEQRKSAWIRDAEIMIRAYLKDGGA